MMIQKLAKSTLLGVVLFFGGCGGDNAYDGTNLVGGNPSSVQGDVLASIQKNILLNNATTLVENLNEVQSTLNSFEQNLSSAEVQSLQSDFVNIIENWKKVEAIYVASEYDSALRTMPINMDFFNKGKNFDVATNIDYVLGLNGSLQTAQVKKTTKTVTGIEYLLFANQASIEEMKALINQDSQKRLEIMKLAVANVYDNALLIQAFYKEDVKFISNVEDTLNILVNTLVQSTFDLRELRIGEAAGFIFKTKDDPKAERLEYFRSKKSLEAIKAILLAHQEVMGQQSFENLASFASSNGADAVVKKIQANLSNALAIVGEFSMPLQNGITPASVDTKIKRLYDEITDLQKNYFESLINALELTPDIIEADGD